MGSTTLRIAQLNTLNNPYGVEIRLQLLQKHLMKINPDVLLLQEVINFKATEKVLNDLGYGFIAVGGPNWIASKLPFIKSEVYRPCPSDLPITTAILELDEVEIQLISAHFPWGFEAIAKRLNYAQYVSQLGKNFEENQNTKERVTIFGGDLNSDEDCIVSKYLHGKALALNNQSTHWTDAWEVSGNESNRWTSDQGENNWGRLTAAKKNIVQPQYLPKRRIDYLLTYGWRYGKIGCPISFDRFGDPIDESGLHLSDHYGIYADYLVKI